MRKFFNPDAYQYDKSGDPIGDPEIRHRTGRTEPDPDLNPQGIDNHLVAKSWFQLANERDLVVPQRRMARLAFRQRPARAHMAFAEMMMKEGRFSEREQQTMTDAWKIGLREWTDRYADGKPGFGRELFDSLAGKIRLEAETDAELKQLTELDNPPGRFSIAEKRRSVQVSRDIVNYNFWKTRAKVEALPETVRAHRDIYQGHMYLKSARLGSAIKLLESGLNRYAKLMQKYPELKTRDESVEEVMIAILAWQEANKLLSNNFPSDQLPPTKPMLYDVWKAHQGQRAEYERLMRRGFRIQ
jgi:hypothetical protein